MSYGEDPPTFVKPTRTRDQRGNLLGGQQNQSMQQYVQSETLEAKEHKRWLAHKEAALHATFPTSLQLNGVDIPIFKFGELEALGQRRLKERALNLRDEMERTKSNFLAHYKLQLNPYSSGETLARWITDVQVTLATALGHDDLDYAAFGAPAHWANGGPSTQQAAPPSRQPDRPCWSQAGVNDGVARTPLQPLQQQQEQVSPPAAFPWSQYGVLDGDGVSPPRWRSGGDWRTAPPSYGGFSLVPPAVDNPADGPRFDDAAHIIRRGHGSSIVLG